MEHIDLGLPSGNLWGKCNLGATTEDEAGLYFQWGDIRGYSVEEIVKMNNKKTFKDDYKTYRFDGSSSDFTKYNSMDRKVELDLEDDAAYVMLGGGWRIPTVEDFVELCKETDIFIVPTEGDEVELIPIENKYYPAYYEFSQIKNAIGIKFYKKWDRSIYIFIPCVGDLYNGCVLNIGTECLLWTSSLNKSNIGHAYYFEVSLSFNVGMIDYGGRYFGFPIRPVYSKK